jgi:hypothetical protein
MLVLEEVKLAGIFIQAATLGLRVSVRTFRLVHFRNLYPSLHLLNECFIPRWPIPALQIMASDGGLSRLPWELALFFELLSKVVDLSPGFRDLLFIF